MELTVFVVVETRLLLLHREGLKLTKLTLLYYNIGHKLLECDTKLV